MFAQVVPYKEFLCSDDYLTSVTTNTDSVNQVGNPERTGEQEPYERSVEPGSRSREKKWKEVQDEKKEKKRRGGASSSERK